MATVEQVERPAWITGAVACQILGCSRWRLKDIAAMGKLSQRKLPGAFVRYRLDEVTRMAAENTVEATGK